MKPQLTFITLGVADLEKSLAFYRDGMGLPSEGIMGAEFEGGATAIFPLANGMMLALYPQKGLAKEAGVRLSKVSTSAMALGYTVDAREEVDEVLQKAEAAGGTACGKPKEKAWGSYTGYFQDIDGHLWEVSYTPVA